MIEVTALVRRWISCGNDLWLRWFASVERAAGEFTSIELSLLDVILLEMHSLSSMGLSAEEFLEKLRVIYPVPIDESRQLCVVQRAGNVYCKPHDVSISAGAIFRVKAVDTMGTMQNGRPYVEVCYGDGYILESPDVIEFAIEVD